MSQSIICPSCGHTFDLGDIHKHELEMMKHQLERETQEKMQKDFDERAKAYAHKVRLEAEEQAKKARLEAEELAQKKERDLEESTRKQSIELESLRKRDEEARIKEIEYLRERQEMEMRAKNMAIEKEQAILEARKALESQLKEQIEKQQSFEQDKLRIEYEKRMGEMQKKLEMTQRAFEDANRKANQGSMQIQGEVQEEAIKELLMQNFPIDIICDVEKGIKGADIIQEVRNEYGQSVGIIAWESKNTKSWSDSWVEKLKEDRLRVKASISVIVSAVLPTGISHFGLYKDIWVTDATSALPLTIALRANLIEISKIQNSLKGKDEKMEVIYNYLVSSEFKSKIENIIEAFSSMREDLDREKRAMEKLWSQREKQLTRVINNTAQLYGDMQGLIGSRLERVEYFELESGEEI